MSTINDVLLKHKISQLPSQEELTPEQRKQDQIDQINDWAIANPTRVLGDDFYQQRQYLTPETWRKVVAELNLTKDEILKNKKIPDYIKSTAFNNSIREDTNEKAKYIAAATAAGAALPTIVTPLVSSAIVAPGTFLSEMALGTLGSYLGGEAVDAITRRVSDHDSFAKMLSSNGIIQDKYAEFFNPGTLLGGFAGGIGGNLLYRNIIKPTAQKAIAPYLLSWRFNQNIKNAKLPQQQLNIDPAHVRVKVGDVEINDPNLAYRQTTEPVAKEFYVTGRQVPKFEEYANATNQAPKSKISLLHKVPFENPMYAQGYLWYELPGEGSTRTGLLVTNQPLQYANKASHLVQRKPIITKDGVTTVYDPSKEGIVGSRRIPLEGQLNSSNTVAYVYGPNYGYRIIKQQQPKTSLAFFERPPAKISKAERLGIPKGQERTIINNEEEILNNAKSFAEKYGYEIPETIDAAKAMYNQHNSFFRTPSNHESVILHYDPELAKLPLEQQYFKLASKGYPESMRSYDFSKNGLYNDDFVFVAPDYGEVARYINDVPAVMLRRPFRKSNPLTWHNDAEWNIQSKYTPYDQVFGKSKIGTAQIGNAGPQHEFKVSTRYLQPVKIAEPTDKGTFLGFHLGSYEYKSGGTIKIKKENKGKFTDYCGGKVTEECIRKGKNSSNPTTRKRANFAWVARHKFKHGDGGCINYLNLF